MPSDSESESAASAGDRDPPAAAAPPAEPPPWQLFSSLSSLVYRARLTLPPFPVTAPVAQCPAAAAATAVADAASCVAADGFTHVVRGRVRVHLPGHQQTPQLFAQSCTPLLPPGALPCCLAGPMEMMPSVAPDGSRQWRCVEAHVHSLPLPATLFRTKAVDMNQPDQRLQAGPSQQVLEWDVHLTADALWLACARRPSERWLDSCFTFFATIELFCGRAGPCRVSRITLQADAADDPASPPAQGDTAAGAPSRQGLGLGLSPLQELADAHGADTLSHARSEGWDMVGRPRDETLRRAVGHLSGQLAYLDHCIDEAHAADRPLSASHAPQAQVAVARAEREVARTQAKVNSCPGRRLTRSCAAALDRR